MARPSTYSAEQRAALIEGVLDWELSAREAAEAAQAGELAVEAFEVPVSTVRHMTSHARRERERREHLTTLPPDEVGHELRRMNLELLAAHDEKLQHTLEGAKRQDGTVSFTELKNLIRCSRELNAMFREELRGTRRPLPPVKDRDRAPTPELSPELQRLEAEVKAQSSGQQTGKRPVSVEVAGR